MRRHLQFLAVAAALSVAVPLVAQIAIPEIPFDSTPNFLKYPDSIVMGEAVGVATNSKGHVFVFTRSGTTSYSVGTSRMFQRGQLSRLYEFDEKGTFVKEIGKGLYAMAFAHTVRVDPQDNIWINDEGADMTIKFSPDGNQVLMTLGRKPESFDGLPMPAPENARYGGRGPYTPGGPIPGEGGGAEGRGAPAAPAAGRGPAPLPTFPAESGPFTTFGRQTDVAWDPAGNIFISDGYNNKRIVKFDKTGKFIKSFGAGRGHGQGQFEDVHTVQVDHQGNVYAGDRSMARITVFDNDGNYKATYTNVGSPWTLCITPGQHQYLYASNSSGTSDMEKGEIYKMELDGTIIGKFGHGGKQLKEFMAVHSMDCRNENKLYTGEISNWRVQELTLHPEQMKK
jgi:hypothetical protein